MVERHKLKDGRAYWKSYDFSDQANNEESNLFLMPLGPVDSGLSEKDRHAFRHEGGELIFQLPNGLNGYLLTDADGKMLRRAPADIVRDKSRHDGRILNGISCIQCHSQGFVRAPADEIRQVYEDSFLGRSMSSAEIGTVRNLYVENGIFNQAIERDIGTFRAALSEIGAGSLPTEPISALYYRFLCDFSEPMLLSELDIEPARLKTSIQEALKQSSNARLSLAAHQVARGLKRNEFIPLYRLMVKELLGGSTRDFEENTYEEFGGVGDGAVPSLDVAFTIPRLDLEMLPIPAGFFLMGSPADERDREDIETQHKVKVSRPFWLGKYEVTQGQWVWIMDNNPSFFKNGPEWWNAPVERVSWEDAQAFCNLVNIREKTAGRLPPDYRYTLPTEAEWEYACRANASWSTAYSSGNRLAESDANFDQQVNKTAKVGTYKPNAWGLHDMHGKVWEWCFDWFEKDYHLLDLTDPIVKGFKTRRVFRGGSWSTEPGLCRTAMRNQKQEDFKDFRLGFRLALSPVQRVRSW